MVEITFVTVAARHLVARLNTPVCLPRNLDHLQHRGQIVAGVEFARFSPQTAPESIALLLDLFGNRLRWATWQLFVVQPDLSQRSLDLAQIGWLVILVLGRLGHKSVRVTQQHLFDALNVLLQRCAADHPDPSDALDFSLIDLQRARIFSTPSRVNT